MKTKLHLILIVTLSLVWLILSANGNVALSAWQPPIGIPAPSFGIEETYRMYDDPANRNPALTYTQNAEGGFYTHYVDNTHPVATNTDNPYGTADRPRLTIPTSLVEGSVVEVHGGSYGFSGSKLIIEGAGTEGKPIFIRGVSELEKPVFVGDFHPQGSYIIAENLYLDYSHIYFRIAYGAGLYGPVDHIAVRNSELEGSGTSATENAISIFSSEAEEPNNIVIYNNHIHHYGDYQASFENDAMGLGVHNTQNVWIVDNHIHHNGGDSVQVQSTSAKYIYIGRNVMHEDRENAVDIKQSEHVIVSENEMYGYVPSSSSEGAAVVVHYDPTLNIWITHNHIYDSQTGIVSSSGPTIVYITDNVIHNTSGSGIAFWNNGEVYAVGNTIYDAGGGIYGSTSAALYMFNNIIANLKSSDSSHLAVWYSAMAAVSNASYNLFYQEGGKVHINWGGSTDYNVSEFKSAFPDKSEGCIEADPQFVDAANNNFNLSAGSPAIDSGILSNVYQTFYDLYGIDIKKDIEGRTRPQGLEWDIGAYEYGASPPYNQPPVANAGPDQTVIDEDNNGSEPVTLDGSASFDPDGTIVSYVWSEGGLQIATGVNPTVTLSTGTHSITLTVTDNGGLTDTDTVTVKVLKGDKEFGKLPRGCYNNVFNPIKGERALIVVELPKQAHVRLGLYNTRGNRIRELADEQKEAGRHKYYWYGKDDSGNVVGSGLYFVHIQAGDYKKTKKIIVVK